MLPLSLFPFHFPSPFPSLPSPSPFPSPLSFPFPVKDEKSRTNQENGGKSYLSFFPPVARDRIITDIFLNNFFRFFLHWNPDIRLVFQHILLYKVFIFEVLSNSTEDQFGNGSKSLTTDETHVDAVSEKIRIITKNFSNKKLDSDPDFRILIVRCFFFFLLFSSKPSHLVYSLPLLSKPTHLNNTHSLTRKMLLRVTKII